VAKQEIKLLYSRVMVSQPLMQDFMDFAGHAGTTVNILGSSVNNESAMFVLELECHNPAMFKLAIDWLRERKIGVEIKV
jgi:hypothetical protein